MLLNSNTTVYLPTLSLVHHSHGSSSAVFALLPIRCHMRVRLRAQRPLALRRSTQSDGATPVNPVSHFLRIL